MSCCDSHPCHGTEVLRPRPKSFLSECAARRATQEIGAFGALHTAYAYAPSMPSSLGVSAFSSSSDLPQPPPPFCTFTHLLLSLSLLSESAIVSPRPHSKLCVSQSASQAPRGKGEGADGRTDGRRSIFSLDLAPGPSPAAGAAAAPLDDTKEATNELGLTYSRFSVSSLPSASQSRPKSRT